MPDYPYFYELKGQILFEAGKAREAIAPLRKAVALAPDAGLIRIMLGGAELSSGDPKLLQSAVADLRVGLNDEPLAAVGYRYLAIAYQQRGQGRRTRSLRPPRAPDRRRRRATRRTSPAAPRRNSPPDRPDGLRPTTLSATKSRTGGCDGVDRRREENEGTGMSRHLSIAAALAAAFLAMVFLAAPSRAEMDAAQKAEIETIIHDYLLANPEVIDEAAQALQKKRDQELAEKQSKAIEEKAATIFNSKNQMVLGNPDGADHAGRVLRLQLHLLPARGLRHDGAACRQSRPSDGDEGVPDPRDGLGRGRAHLRRGQGDRARQISGLPPGALLAPRPGERGKGAGGRDRSRPRHRRAEGRRGRRRRDGRACRRCTSSPPTSASPARRPT